MKRERSEHCWVGLELCVCSQEGGKKKKKKRKGKGRRGKEKGGKAHGGRNHAPAGIQSDHRYRPCCFAEVRKGRGKGKERKERKKGGRRKSGVEAGAIFRLRRFLRRGGEEGGERKKKEKGEGADVRRALAFVDSPSCWSSG